MQRTFLIGLFALLSSLAGSGFAQLHGSGVLRGPNIGALGRPVPNPPSYGYRGGGYARNSRYGYGRYGGGYGIGGYPVFVGGFSSDYYPGYTDPYLSGASVPDFSQTPPAPPVVINQYFGAPPQSGGPYDDPSVQVYQGRGYQGQNQQPSYDASPSSAEPRSYLIAYKDHSVYSALAYWVEDHTLNYVTMQNVHNQADMSLIDVDLTKKLNQDRNMAFNITPTQAR